MLLTLLVLPIAVAVYLWLERRRAKYAMTFTNVEVLASVVRGRSLRRYVPPVLALLDTLHDVLSVSNQIADHVCRHDQSHATLSPS